MATAAAKRYARAVFELAQQEGDLEQWARKLAATGWGETYVYFMHEPTAPAYAQTLMRFAPS